MRTIMAACLAACLGFLAAAPLAAFAQAQTHALDLPAQPLAASLASFSKQTGIQVFTAGELAAGRTAPAVAGTFTAAAALSRLLAGSGLEARREGNVFVVQRAAPTSEQQMPEVRVTEAATRDRTEGTRVYAVPETSSATKLNLSPRETPQTVVVVPAQVIEDFQLTDMRRMLDLAPGVYVDSERNLRAFQFWSRGFLMQNQFDGVPSPITIDGRGTMAPDAATIDRVEILQGASGLLTGPGFPGGVVNLMRKMPTAARQSSMEASADSWGGLRLVGDVSGPVNESGSVRARLVAGYENNKSFVDYVQAKKSLLYGVIEASLGSGTVVSVGLDIQTLYDASNGPSYGGPTAFDGSDLGLPRSQNLGASWARDDTSSQMYFVKLDQALAGQWKLKGGLSYGKTDAYVLNSVPWGAVDPATGLGNDLWGSIESWTQYSTSFDAYATGPFTLFGRRHELMLGTNGSERKQWTSSYIESSVPLSSESVYTRDPAAIPNPFSVPWVDYDNALDVVTKQYGVFAGGRFSLADPLHVILGSRLSWYEAKTNGVVSAEEAGVVTPYAGVVWDFTRALSAYASYTDIFEAHPVSTKDVGGSVLPPITGKSYEVGVKGEFAGGRLNASAAVFRLEQSNLAELDTSVPFDPGNACGGDCYKASGLVKSEGVDLGIAGEITPRWRVLGGYVHLTQNYAAGPDQGKPFRTMTPRDIFKLATTYDLPGGDWTLGANARYQSAIYMEDLTVPYRIEQKAYTVFGAMARYRLGKKSSAQLNIDNLFDETYYSGITDPVHGQIYGEPRRARVTVRFDF